ncbi:MAG: DUF4159 domain-containing protein [Alphaproteobacteria bacterium]|nr:DUF4159 domain-containing protein [Alphaproteobacteria bacterium]
MLSALSFTSPLILTALAVLPVIWWLLRATPPSPKTVRFPAFIILRRLKTVEETPDRTPWQLLLLRLLLAAFVILGLAGPILNAPAPTPGAGPIMLVIDNSWAAAANWRARRDVIYEAAAQATQSDREVFIVTTAPQRIETEIEPITGAEARLVADNLETLPFLANREGAIARLTTLGKRLSRNDFEVSWLSDGVSSPHDASFLTSLKNFGDVRVFNDPDSNLIILRPAGQNDEGPIYRAERLSITGPWEGTVIATARDGRELARIQATMADGQKSVDVTLAIPLALRNELSSIRLENTPSAGGVQLIDSRDRRALVGLISTANQGRNNLLTGSHYLRQALGPYAEFLDGSLSALLESDISVIILDDVGTLRSSDVEALSSWVEGGGVLIRFAGPTLAVAAQDRAPALLPVVLRGGGRAFGGALTWDTPQLLDAFPDDGPFGGLTAPDDVFVRKQILAQPGSQTTERSWARLKDGTPLVTGERRGDGVIALFHITATPQWSDLPASEIFINMLRRLIFLSTLGPESAEGTEQTRYPALRLMDGAGQLRQPPDDALALTIAELAQAPGPDRHPGFYGSNDTPLALNVVNAETPFEPLKISGAPIVPYAAAPPRQLSPPLFTLALIMLLIDGLATLWMSGRLRFQRAAAAILAITISAISFPIDHALAQPLDTAIDQKTTDAALATRLAYVKTGDPAVDLLSSQGLAALSRELYRRTSIEPGAPVMIDLETDDLSVYPFLYWPIVPGGSVPSDAALASIENFMRFGGLILFDTRDDERAISPGSTPEAQALQQIMSALDIPPLRPLESGHVLSRSFYLLTDLHGRHNNNPVWVAAETSGANDGVTPLIIGGRDWAGAWATDDIGREIKPMGRWNRRSMICTASKRECAYRAGINIVMVAFTGNYKSDQVHMPILLERLGE